MHRTALFLFFAGASLFCLSVYGMARGKQLMDKKFSIKLGLGGWIIFMIIVLLFVRSC